jgi:uncharacterized protein YacL
MLGFAKSKNYKVLDSSVLVDGRIVGILNTGFLEGSIIVPEFILKELHALADSQNQDKRKKGQRGLDTLLQMQKIWTIEISNKTYKEMDDITEADAKLVIFCKKENAKLLSLDNNLNKIAKIHNVAILNINDLFSAIRPLVVYGQKMSVKVVRAGEQDGQGISALEDGTMVIVDGGDKYIGKKIQVEVRQVLSTTSGRLVFAKISHDKTE